MKVGMGPRDKFPLMADINMIPLIDVALVLLIIFMVLTPILVSSQIKINVPKAVTGIAPDADPIKIQITSKQSYYVDGQMVALDDLANALRRKIGDNKSPVVLIEADSSVPFDFVVKAMDRAREMGAQKLGVAVNPQK